MTYKGFARDSIIQSSYTAKVISCNESRVVHIYVNGNERFLFGNGTRVDSHVFGYHDCMLYR